MNIDTIVDHFFASKKIDVGEVSVFQDCGNDYLFYKSNMLASRDRYLNIASTNKFFRTEIYNRLAVRIINAIVYKYHETLGIEKAGEISYPLKGLIKQGDRTACASGSTKKYPIFQEMAVRSESELYEVLLKHLIVESISKKADIDFLARSEKDQNLISYIPVDRIDRCEGNPFDITIRNKYAMSGKPIKVLKKAYYFSAKTGERFLENFRIPTPSFSLLPPEKIPLVYMLPSSKQLMSNTLGSSCMKNKPAETFDFFVKNAFGILCAYDKEKNDQLLGRAIIWKFKHEGEDITFMDRVYTGDHKFEASFFHYATKEGWYRKSIQSHRSQIEVTNPSGVSGHTPFSVPMKEAKGYPYLDTFRWMNANMTRMTNSGDKMRSWRGGYYEACSTSGNVNDKTTVEIYSEYHNETYLKSQMREIEDEGWVLREYTRNVYPNKWVLESRKFQVRFCGNVYVLEEEAINYEGLWYHTTDVSKVGKVFYPNHLVVKDELTKRNILVANSVVLNDGRITHKKRAVLREGLYHKKIKQTITAIN